MSYYHFFKLKEDSKYKDTTIEDCNEKLSKSTQDYAKDKAVFYASMINAYYEENVATKYSTIKWGLLGFTYNAKWYDDYRYLKQMLEDDEQELWRNRPPEEYEMERQVEDYEDDVNRIVERLLILATVRFVPDEKYSDTPKTVMDYLSTEYINKINEEIDLLDDITNDYTFAKFVLENCSRETEDQKYAREHPEDKEEDIGNKDE